MAVSYAACRDRSGLVRDAVRATILESKGIKRSQTLRATRPASSLVLLIEAAGYAFAASGSQMLIL